MSSSTAASVTAMAMRYLCLYLSSGCATACGVGADVVVPSAPAAVPGLTVVLTTSSPRHDVGFDGHARPERLTFAAAASDLNPNRHTLHDLGEVPRGVVGRQQGELRSCRRADALHFPFRLAPVVGIDVELRGA